MTEYKVGDKVVMVIPYDSAEKGMIGIIKYIDDDIMDKETWISDIDHSMSIDDKKDVGNILMKKLYHGNVNIIKHIILKFSTNGIDEKIINSLKDAFKIK